MSTHVITTNDQGFDTTVLRAEGPVLVDFWAEWCPPCKMMAPIIEELAAEYQGRLRVVSVNAEESPAVASRFGIMSMPSLVFFREGQAIHRLIGSRPKARLRDAIEQVLGSAGVPVSHR